MELSQLKSRLKELVSSLEQGDYSPVLAAELSDHLDLCLAYTTDSISRLTISNDATRKTRAMQKLAVHNLQKTNSEPGSLAQDYYETKAVAAIQEMQESSTLLLSQLNATIGALHQLWFSEQQSNHLVLISAENLEAAQAELDLYKRIHD